jgi:hypothetical protein
MPGVSPAIMTGWTPSKIIDEERSHSGDRWWRIHQPGMTESPCGGRVCHRAEPQVGHSGYGAAFGLWQTSRHRVARARASSAFAGRRQALKYN